MPFWVGKNQLQFAWWCLLVRTYHTSSCIHHPSGIKTLLSHSPSQSLARHSLIFHCFKPFGQLRKSYLLVHQNGWLNNSVISWSSGLGSPRTIFAVHCALLLQGIGQFSSKQSGKQEYYLSFSISRMVDRLRQLGEEPINAKFEGTVSMELVLSWGCSLSCNIRIISQTVVINNEI